MLKVKKSFNNNLILATDSAGTEVILKGKGIGFHKQRGDAVDEHLVEATFRPENENESSRFLQLFSSIPDDYWTIAEELLVWARETQGLKLSQKVILPLCDHLAGAVERAAREGGGVLAEDFIAGREIQISVLGGRALPSIEIVPGAGFYDYRSKYQPGAARELSPADIPPETEERLAAAALAMYRALGLRALARADFILDAEGRLWFLEFNSLPGMTPTSLAPQEAAAAGMSYEELCQRIIDLAFEEERT